MDYDKNQSTLSFYEHTYSYSIMNTILINANNNFQPNKLLYTFQININHSWFDNKPIFCCSKTKI